MTAAQGATVLRLLRTTTARIVIGILLAVGLYALAGFVIAPKILRSKLLTEIPKTVDVVPSVGDIQMNPFLFQLEVRNFALAGHDGTQLFKFDRLFVDFDLSSLWHRAYTFVQIELDSPAVNAVVAPNGVINLMALKPKQAPAPAHQAPKENAPLPALRVSSLRVTQASLGYEDRSRPTPFAARIEPITFELRDFTTGVAGGLFRFTGASKQGERLEWHGHLSVQPVASDGEIRIQGLKARTLWEYLQDQVNFVVASGTLDVQSTYKFSLTDRVNLGLDVAKTSLTDLAIRPKDSDTDWVSLPALDVSGTKIDLAQRSVSIDSVSLTGLKVLAWLEPDGTVNLIKLGLATQNGAPSAGGAPASTAPVPPAPAATAPPSAGGAPASVANVPAVPAATVPPSAIGAPAAAAAPTLTTNAPPAASPWKLDLHELALHETSLSAEDRTVQPAVKVALSPLSLTVRGVSLDMTKSVAVALDTKINEAGSLAIDGEITPQPLAASLKLKMSEIDLAIAQPYLARQTALVLRSGKLGGDTQLSYGSKPAVKLTGNLYVQNLHTVDAVLHDDLVSWERLDVRGLDFEQAPNRLAIEEIAVRKPYSRVIIEPDASLNVARVLQAPSHSPSSAAPKPANVGVGAQKSASSEALTAQAQRIVEAQQAAQAPAVSRRQARDARKARTMKREDAAVAEAAARKPAQPAAGWPMSIRKIRLEAGRTDFTDLSIKPNFSAGIKNLGGTVLGLSSDPKSRAKVDLQGSVDQFSPVSISGEINVLSAALYTDLTLGFHNMELSIFNPYSGKWAGYNITKGKLNADMHYKVVDRQLDAQHHIVIDQLEFGDKTASKDAVSLPVKLAVALLKDRNGVIDLPLPVTGSLDDPHFRLGPIIWKVVLNLLEKAVTAPFALLGSLFGSGPDLQFIDFKPGSAELDPAQADKVKSIVKALQERPQLKLDVPIAAIPDLDRPALVAAALDSQITEAQAGSQKGSRKASTPAAAFAQLDPPAQLEVLTHLYQRELGGDPRYPDEVSAIKPKAQLVAAKVAFLEGQLRDHLTVGPEQLTALGQQRAFAVQQALLTDSGIDAARVFLVANDKAQAQQGEVRLELSLR